MTGPVSSQSHDGSLADVLERVLDKGIVIAGDIRVNLLDIELLSIRIRLLVASVDKAREMGIDWWARPRPGESAVAGTARRTGSAVLTHRRRGRASMTATYIYALIRPLTESAVTLDVVGIDKEKVRVVEHDDVAAVVSAIDETRFADAEAVKASLTDLHWIEA